MKLPKPALHFGAAILILAMASSHVAAQRKAAAEVVVLSTLHNFHEGSKYYSFATLARTIERIRPDVIAVELTAADLESRRKQKVKVEYERSVFPIADKHRFEMVALEPAPQRFGELVGLVQGSEKELRETSPQKAEAFSLYSDALYEYLFKKWDSPIAVNSAETDAMFEVKHAYQNKLFGAKQQQGWEGWNRNFLDVIVTAAQKNQGKRILVLVGVEHAYWLRAHLRGVDGVRLLDTVNVIKSGKN